MKEHFDVFERSGDIIKAIPKCVFITTNNSEKVNCMACDSRYRESFQAIIGDDCMHIYALHE